MLSRYKLTEAVQKRLKDEDLTAENVIRKALGMEQGFTTSDGTYFPEGTAFVGWYEDESRSAHIKNGALTIGKETFTSLSAAAAHYTGIVTTNGWDFFHVKLPNSKDMVRANTLGPRYSLESPKPVTPIRVSAKARRKSRA